MGQKKKRWRKKRFGLWSGLVGSAIWAAIAVFLFCKFVGTMKPSEGGVTVSELGDFLAGWFAPLAFGWFVYTAITQRRELEAARDAYRDHTEVGSKAAKQAEVQNLRKLLDDFADIHDDFIDNGKQLESRVRQLVDSAKMHSTLQLLEDVSPLRPLGPKFADVQDVASDDVMRLAFCFSYLLDNKQLDWMPNGALNQETIQQLRGFSLSIHVHRSSFKRFYRKLEKIYDKDVLTVSLAGSWFSKYYHLLEASYKSSVVLLYDGDEIKTVPSERSFKITASDAAAIDMREISPVRD